MNNEDYARRVTALYERIARMYPYPPGDYYDNESDWKHAHRRRERQRKRILALPERWRKLPARTGCYCSNTLGPRQEHQRCASCPMRGLTSV